jgi:alpha-mannosidase
MIRRLTVRDAERVLEFLLALDEASVRFFHPHQFDLDHVLRLLRGRLSGAVDAFGAADSDGSLTGYVWLSDMQTAHPSLGICVAEGRRDRGLGRALMVRALDEAALRAKAEVRLSVMPENARALHLYTSLGFEVASTVEGRHGPYLCMTCRLDTSAAARAAVVRKRLSGADIGVVPYSHPDWAWVHTRHWHAHRYALVFAEVLREMDRDPAFRWYCDNFACQMSALIEHRPELLPDFRRRVAEGKVDVCGGYANVRPNMVGDETFVRSLVLGRRAWAETVPEAVVVVHGDAVDVAVGHSQMPQLLTLGGFRHLRMWRPYGALAMKGIPNDFVWRGADGSEVLVSRGCYGGLWAFDGAKRVLLDPRSAHPDEVVCALWDTDLEVRVRYAETPLAWLAVGCDDARPNRLIDDTPFDVAGLIGWWNAREPGTMRFATPTEYFTALAQHQDRLQTIEGVLDPCDVAYNAAWNGELGLHQVRIANDRLLTEAETFDALAWGLARCDLGAAGRSECAFDELWKEHLLTCAHATQWLYCDDFRALRDRAERVRLEATRVRDDAIRAIARSEALPDDTVWLVANPLPWRREVVVELVLSRFGDDWPVRLTDRDGAPVPHQVVHEHRGQGGYAEQLVAARVSLPPAGVAALRQAPAEPDDAASGGEWTGLDNGVVGVTMRDGRIVALSYSDQVAGSAGTSRCVLEAPLGMEWGGLALKLVDVRNGPLHVGPIAGERVVEWTRGEALEHGPVRWRYRRAGAVGGLSVTMDVILTAGSARVDFEVSVEWPGLDGFLAARFPLLTPCRMFGDVPFAVEPRDIAGEPYVKDHWVSPHSMEHARGGLFFARSFVAVEGADEVGYALIGINTDRYYLRHATGRYLEHILINSVATLDDWEHEVEPSTLSGRGPHRFRFALLPYRGGWRAAQLVRKAAEARSEPIVLEAVRSASPSPAGGGPAVNPVHHVLPAGPLRVSPNVALTAFRQVDGAFEMRLHECAGEAATAEIGLPFEPASAVLTDFIGNPIPGMVRVSGRQVALDVTPWQIATIRLVAMDRPRAGRPE